MVLRRLSLLALLWALAACEAPVTPASNQVAPPPSASGVADENADESVAAAEWDQRGDDVFARLDADDSGDLSPAEVEAGYDVFDVNGDGVLTRDEVRSDTIDANGDGIITREEWRGADLVGAYDADSDALISRREYRQRRRSDFNDLDGDRNGSLSRNELSDDALGGTLFRF